jgi:hypothetical protein
LRSSLFSPALDRSRPPAAHGSGAESVESVLAQSSHTMWLRALPERWRSKVGFHASLSLRVCSHSRGQSAEVKLPKLAPVLCVDYYHISSLSSTKVLCGVMRI